jgi:hypothetical protein
MLVLLLSSLIQKAELHYAIDVGSQYVRIGQIDNVTREPKVLSVGGRSLIPAAVALKTNVTTFTHLPSDDFQWIKVLIGKAASSHLEKHPRAGLRFPSLATSRNGTEYETSKLLAPTEYLALYAAQLLQRFPAPDSVSLTFPGILTGSQTTLLVNAFRFAHFPIGAIYDDVSVMSHYYMARFSDRFRRQAEWRVLFIDAGAAYFKCFVQNFTTVANGTVIETMGIDWSEKVSVSAFVRALAKSTRLSFVEAEKLLRSSGDNPAFAYEEIRELKRFMRAFMEMVGPIHEFQIYGGGANLAFYAETIEPIVNRFWLSTNLSEMFIERPPHLKPDMSRLRHDFDPNHAVLHATLRAVSFQRKLSGEGMAPIEMRPKPPVSSFIDWGNQTAKYCQKNTGCKKVGFQFRPGYDRIEIRADPRHVPPGAPVLSNVYTLKNISEIEWNETDPGFIALEMEKPRPVIAFVVYQNKSGYWPIAHEPVPLRQKEMDDSYAYFQEVIGNVNEMSVKGLRLKMIKKAVEKMQQSGNDSLLTSGGTGHMLRTANEKVNDLKAKVNDGTFKNMSAAALKEVLQEIEGLARILGFEVV